VLHTRQVLGWVAFKRLGAPNSYQQTETYTGCLRSFGQRRPKSPQIHRERFSGTDVAELLRTAGPYLAFDEHQTDHYFNQVHTVPRRQPPHRRARVDRGCSCAPRLANGSQVAGTIDSLVVGAGGAAAWRVVATYQSLTTPRSSPRRHDPRPRLDRGDRFALDQKRRRTTSPTSP